MARNKVTVIGAGNVGATTAQRIAEAGLADVVLVDIVEGLPQGKALDLAEAAPGRRPRRPDHRHERLRRHRRARTSSSSRRGLARQPGMSRDDLLAKNAGIVRAVVEQAAKHSPDAILIVVTNPLDAMCHVALTASGLPARTRARDGRRPRFGALPDVHRARSSASRSRTPTRSSSAATATRWCRCRATRRSPASRSPSCCSPERVAALVRADRQRRRRGRGPAQDRLCLLRAGRVDLRDGRVDPARSQARPAVRRPAQGRVRDRRTCSSACRSSSARAGWSASSRSS